MEFGGGKRNVEIWIGLRDIQRNFRVVDGTSLEPFLLSKFITYYLLAVTYNLGQQSSYPVSMENPPRWMRTLLTLCLRYIHTFSPQILENTKIHNVKNHISGYLTIFQFHKRRLKCSMIKGNKQITDWQINHLKGYVLHKWTEKLSNTLWVHIRFP